LNGAAHIIGGFKFISKDQPLSIMVIFANSNHDANSIATGNSFPWLPHAKWTVNGYVFHYWEMWSVITRLPNGVNSLVAY